MTPEEAESFNKTNWEFFSEQFSRYKDTLVMDWFKLYKLVGLEDGEDDYYWILMSRKGKQKYLSCCIIPVWLKEELTEPTYKVMVQLWNLNSNNTAV